MDTLERARQLLKDCTPLNRDCGGLCGHACCLGDETGENGMLLFPGEERYYEGNPDFTLAGGKIICQGRCDRDLRPLGCRVFPLVILNNAKVKMDIRAWPVCPLMQSGKKGLRQDFIEKVQQAAALLWNDEEQRAFVEKTTADILEYEALKKLF